MGLILCENITAKKPIYIEELSINIYTIEELCYIIYEHPLLVLDGFISDKLIEFIREELELTTLAKQLEKIMHDKSSNENGLLYILEYAEFYTTKEIAKYKTVLANYKWLKKPELMKAKADYMFSLGRYGRAIRHYRAIINNNNTVKGAGRKNIGKAYHNMASCYARLFLYEKAYRSYEEAYKYLGDKDIIRKMYMIARMEGVISKKEAYMSELSAHIDPAWDEEYESLRSKSNYKDKIQEVENIFEKNVLQKQELCIDIVSAWRNKYRNMI